MFGFALRNLRSRPARSLLALAGLTVAIAGMVGLFSVAEGLNASAEDAFSKVDGLTALQPGAPRPAALPHPRPLGGDDRGDPRGGGRRHRRLEPRERHRRGDGRLPPAVPAGDRHPRPRPPDRRRLPRRARRRPVPGRRGRGHHPRLLRRRHPGGVRQGRRRRADARRRRMRNRRHLRSGQSLSGRRDPHGPRHDAPRHPVRPADGLELLHRTGPRHRRGRPEGPHPHRLGGGDAERVGPHPRRPHRPTGTDRRGPVRGAGHAAAGAAKPPRTHRRRGLGTTRPRATPPWNCGRWTSGWSSSTASLRTSTCS